MAKIPWEQNGQDSLDILDRLWQQRDDDIPQRRRVEVDAQYRERLRERRRAYFNAPWRRRSE